MGGPVEPPSATPEPAFRYPGVPPALISDLGNMQYGLQQTQAALLELRNSMLLRGEVPGAPTAPASSAAPVNSVFPRLSVRLADPRHYAGKEGEDVEEYLNSMEQYFLLGDVTGDHKRILLAGQYLAGSARDWYVITYQVSDLLANAGRHTWDSFKSALRIRFVTRDPADIARVKLFRLYQGRQTLRDFTLQFQYLATRSGTTSDADLKALYLDRLDTNIASQVGLHFPATLTDAIRLAEQTVVHGRPTSMDYRRPPPWQPPRAPQRSGATPMELGAMNRNPPANRGFRGGRPTHGTTQKKGPSQGTPGQSLRDLGVTPAQYEERKRSGACLACGQSDHVIKACPTLNRAPGNGTRLRQT